MLIRAGAWFGGLIVGMGVLWGRGSEDGVRGGGKEGGKE